MIRHDSNCSLCCQSRRNTTSLQVMCDITTMTIQHLTICLLCSMSLRKTQMALTRGNPSLRATQNSATQLSFPLPNKVSRTTTYGDATTMPITALCNITRHLSKDDRSKSPSHHTIGKRSVLCRKRHQYRRQRPRPDTTVPLHASWRIWLNTTMRNRQTLPLLWKLRCALFSGNWLR